MRESVRIMRFAIVGTLNALITALIVGLLMHIEGEHYMIANVVAYVVAQIHNFIWSKYWIFPLDANRKKNTIWHESYFRLCLCCGIRCTVPVSLVSCRGMRMQ